MMAPEHVEVIRAWERDPEVRADYRRHPRGAVLGRLRRLAPPALVRAAIILTVEHLSSGRPLTLPDDVAEIYLGDPSAFPGAACDRCGYLMPVQAEVRPDGAVAYTGYGYLGPCPVCEGHPDNQGGIDA